VDLSPRRTCRCVTWRMRMRDMTHSYSLSGHESKTYMPVCDMMCAACWRVCEWHVLQSERCVTWCVRARDISKYTPPPTHMMCASARHNPHACHHGRTRSHTRVPTSPRFPCRCVTWLMYTCDVLLTYVWHDSLLGAKLTCSCVFVVGASVSVLAAASVSVLAVASVSVLLLSAGLYVEGLVDWHLTTNRVDRHLTTNSALWSASLSRFNSWSEFLEGMRLPTLPAGLWRMNTCTLSLVHIFRHEYVYFLLDGVLDVRILQLRTQQSVMSRICVDSDRCVTWHICVDSQRCVTSLIAAF